MGTSISSDATRRPSLPGYILSGKRAILGATRIHVPRAARHRLLTHDLRATVTLRQVAPELLLRRHRTGGPRPVSCATRGMRLAPAQRAVCRPSRRARARRLMNDSRMSTCEGLAEACPGSLTPTQPWLRVVAATAWPAKAQRPTNSRASPAHQDQALGVQVPTPR